MITQDKARRSKDQVRLRLQNLGFTVVSIGLSKLGKDWVVEAGVLQKPSEKISNPRSFSVNDIQVKVHQQTAPKYNI